MSAWPLIKLNFFFQFVVAENLRSTCEQLLSSVDTPQRWGPCKKMLRSENSLSLTFSLKLWRRASLAIFLAIAPCHTLASVGDDTKEKIDALGRV